MEKQWKEVMVSLVTVNNPYQSTDPNTSGIQRFKNATWAKDEGGNFLVISSNGRTVAMFTMANVVFVRGFGDES